MAPAAAVGQAAASAAACQAAPAADTACSLHASKSTPQAAAAAAAGITPSTTPAAAAAAAAAATAATNTVPLHQLQLSSHAPLQAATRRPCPSCHKPRAFFCYDCLIPLMQGMPKFTALPVDVHIVMHGESNAQATGTHAAVLAPQCVTLWRHNNGTSHHRRQPASKLLLPDWDPATTAVLYPESPETPVVGLWGWLEHHGNSKQQQQQVGEVDSGGAEHAAEQQQLLTALQQLSCSPADAALAAAAAAQGGSGSAAAGGPDAVTTSSSSSSGQQVSPFPYKAVVILEGNWAKARTLLKHPKLASLPRLQLPQNVRSLFWRRGTGSFRAAVDCGVCTIEALYLLCRQLQPQPRGYWDDLLWLWVYQRQLVQQRGSRQTRQEMQQNYEAACGAAQ
uniref:tRNA-uridine aminocarboxypropyltransferase 1 n=1 Tax=Tetradesmus obliquus TaxID=3088 RepID=A0A383VAL2_TETOB|eukprot:jgi/Sobl393_1/15004/SZX61983.1